MVTCPTKIISSKTLLATATTVLLIHLRPASLPRNAMSLSHTTTHTLLKTLLYCSTPFHNDIIPLYDYLMAPLKMASLN